jgi:hypothetical protein
MEKLAPRPLPLTLILILTLQVWNGHSCPLPSTSGDLYQGMPSGPALSEVEGHTAKPNSASLFQRLEV